MTSDRIEFISAYCDAWCERCAFTQRCSAFAARVAIAMCEGNVKAGLELAVGQAPPAEPDGRVSQWPVDDDSRDGPEWNVDAEREYRERHARIETSPLTPAARAYAILARRWLVESAQRFRSMANPAVHEALSVIRWDHALIAAKLNRALHGRDAYQQGESGEHPVQNDWNGSAKVALISLDRSEAAWRVVASCLPGEIPAIMADHLAQLRADVDAEFPDARRFVRPGFDEAQPV